MNNKILTDPQGWELRSVRTFPQARILSSQRKPRSSRWKIKHLTNKGHLSSSWAVNFKVILLRHFGETPGHGECGCYCVWREEWPRLPCLLSTQLPKEWKTSPAGKGQVGQTWPVNPGFKKMFQLNWPYLWTCYQSHLCLAPGVQSCPSPSFLLKLCKLRTWLFKKGCVCVSCSLVSTLCDPMDSSPQILEWVAIPFSRGSSWPRDGTHVSCIAGRFFIAWATREASRLNETQPHYRGKYALLKVYWCKR